MTRWAMAGLDAQDNQALDRIRQEAATTFFVEAGAGTGKTAALVSRIVGLIVQDWTTIDRIVAVTFTERAAAELSDRVRAGLEEALEVSPDRSHLIQSAIDSLERAQISTIHSFCRSLLRLFAAEAGVDPSFDVLDEVLTERRFGDSWRSFLDAVHNERVASGAIDRALALGMTTRNIETLAYDLASRPELAPLLENPAVPSPLWPNLATMREELASLALTQASADDDLRVRVEGVLGLVNSLCRPNIDRESVLASGAAVLGESMNVSSIDAWSSRETISQVRDTAKSVIARLLATLENCRTKALADLMPLVVRFVREDAVDRARDGTMTFDDLILLTCDLLRDNLEARRVLQGQFDVLLIDEFQDTDPLQVSIALAFIGDSGGGGKAGRLFLVGDPKQSIYRFRGADMATYAETKTAVVRGGGDSLPLAVNRRSRPVILGWVNAVFGPLFGEGGDPNVQAPYVGIKAIRDSALKGPGVAWLGGELADHNARESRQVEAAAIARQCRAALEEGWEVEGSDEPGRRATYGDIAILIPSRTILAPLERALAEADVPFRVEGGSLVYRTQEVRDLLNCLTAIDDPADEVAIVGALRSPAFACSDVDLALHKATGGRFNYRSPDTESRQGVVADGLRTLAEYHATRHTGSIASLVERFAADRGLVEIGILDSGGRNSFRRVRFVVEQARVFEAAGAESLRSFVSWLERRAGDQILDNEGADLDDDEDAVRVLTVHAAKGLEFPIVFMAGFSWAPNNRTPTYGRVGNQVAVAIGSKSDNRSFGLGPAAEFGDVETRHSNAEYARLMYVAATRARDHLLVSLYHSRRALQRSGVKRLIEHGAAQRDQERPPLAPARARRVEPLAQLGVEHGEHESEGEFKAARDMLVSSRRGRQFTSATAIKGLNEDRENMDESEPWGRGRGGTRRGRAVHATIQSLPLNADIDRIRAVSMAQATAEAIPHRAGEVEKLVAWILRSSQAAERARAASRALREVPFAYKEGDVVVEGFVDLIIESASGIEIVDWKTDEVEPSEVAERLRQYETQAGLYVLGIEAATGRTVDAITYVFAAPGVERSPGNPARLAEAARRKLAAGRDSG